jgi:hypothetical protein
MTDFGVAVVCGGFALLIWGLTALCDRLMEHPR